MVGSSEWNLHVYYGGSSRRSSWITGQKYTEDTHLIAVHSMQIRAAVTAGRRRTNAGQEWLHVFSCHGNQLLPKQIPSKWGRTEQMTPFKKKPVCCGRGQETWTEACSRFQKSPYHGGHLLSPSSSSNPFSRSNEILFNPAGLSGSRCLAVALPLCQPVCAQPDVVLGLFMATGWGPPAPSLTWRL